LQLMKGTRFNERDILEINYNSLKSEYKKSIEAEAKAARATQDRAPSPSVAPAQVNDSSKSPSISMLFKGLGKAFSSTFLGTGGRKSL